MPRPRSTLDVRRATAALAADGGRRRSMAEIAALVGVAKPTLYKLAPSRAALEALCVEAEAERLIERLPRGGGPGLPAVVAAVEDLAADSPGAPTLLFGGATAAAAAAVRRVEDRLALALREEPDPGEAAAALLGGAVAVWRRRQAEPGGPAGTRPSGATPSRPT